MHIVYKQIGETPLQCIQRLFNTEENTYTYAGRLDPMAEGLLLILENEECKQAKQFHHLTKAYTYSFITGISTDTYDCLGKITDMRNLENPLDKKIQQVIRDLNSTQTLPYPPYSSKTVHGIPLFQYARENTLHTIPTPTNTIQITEHKLINTHTTDTKTIAKEIVETIQNIQGDFRQEEIIKQWQTAPNQTLQQYSATIVASGGTYIRAIVHEVGRRINCPTTTTHIRRTKIGKWTKPGTYTL